MEEARTKYRRDVQVKMQTTEEQRKRELMMRRNEQDYKVQKTMEEKFKEQIITKEVNNLKREAR